MPFSVGRVGPAGSTTIALPTAGTTTTLTSRALVALQKVFFTAESISDPQRLYKVLYDIQRFASLAIRPLGENPLSFGNPIGPVAMVSGTTQLLSHRLGRAYQGWYCVRAQGTSWVGVEAALPAGASASQIIALKPGSTGTYSFLVW